MAVSTTVFRDQVALMIGDALGGMRVVPGMLEGPIEKRDLACVFPLLEEENDENTNEEILTIGIRVYQAFKPPTPTGPPYDPVRLEEWTLAVKQALAGPWGSLGVWYARVTRVEYDLETQGAEITVVGWQDNPQSVT